MKLIPKKGPEEGTFLKYGPTSEFDLMEDAKKLGRIQIRHKPTSGDGVPDSFASHIYYEIEKSEQGKGYGTEILRLGLEEAKKIGLKEVILTCYEDNVGSKAIIEKNGGKLLDKCVIEGRNYLKYRITID